MEPEVGTFAWAVKMIAEGKKVTRPCWIYNLGIEVTHSLSAHAINLVAMRSKGMYMSPEAFEIAGFLIDDFQATDWMVVE